MNAPAPETRPPRHDEAAHTLLAFAAEVAADTGVVARLVPHPTERTWVRLAGPDGSEAWLIGWPPGTTTGWHDHGGSCGALVVVRGELTEHALAMPAPLTSGQAVRVDNPGITQRCVPPGHGLAFGPDHVHAMANESPGTPAVSVHAYHPRLPWMRKYLLTGDRLVVSHIEYAEEWTNDR
ncbi:MAG TPA: cysteine dioxygenase [Yinghuangia sp.]|uniref:cysteine dioxygenase n=1 Tax=Yinghuangia sp. YIM S10712 TaxID=3436930 RepID=UPI002CEE3A24|nr:cysteine dioxygenase [Yinghuangia sp.]